GGLGPETGETVAVEGGGELGGLLRHPELRQIDLGEMGGDHGASLVPPIETVEKCPFSPARDASPPAPLPPRRPRRERRGHHRRPRPRATVWCRRRPAGPSGCSR